MKGIPAELEAKILATEGVKVLSGPPLPRIDRRPILETVDEKDFQRELMKMAKNNGWKCFHPKYSYKSEKGFFDVTMIRGNRVIFTELKTETGTQSAEQKTWMEFAQAVGGNVEYYLWRPSDWAEIQEVLK